MCSAATVRGHGRMRRSTLLSYSIHVNVRKAEQNEDEDEDEDNGDADRFSSSPSLISCTCGNGQGASLVYVIQSRQMKAIDFIRYIGMSYRVSGDKHNQQAASSSTASIPREGSCLLNQNTCSISNSIYSINQSKLH
jgi:hypothetical protein